MAMTLAQVQAGIEKIAPPLLAEPWDNGGFQLIGARKEIRRIFVCLELTAPVAAEALEMEADLILIHHPMFFDPIRSLSEEAGVGKICFPLIRAGVSVYAAHTSFDKAKGGNNDFLLELLQLEGKGIMGTGAFEEQGIGRLFRLEEEAALGSVQRKLEKALELPTGRIRRTGKRDAVIRTIGVCTGAGASLIPDCLANGCQALITGDIRYHDAQTAKAAGLALLDAGHYDTEKIFAPNFVGQLTRLLGADVEIFSSKTAVDPFE